ncbi:MerR family transcriptional regulator [Pueribacillus theae]|uniref:MerR family transcriptional regulator n=1 Tax=Pueribacillus theae TaxID=2171751 RepID=A0A2U1K6T9_9BACI|nr:MerR family transcriptional regulator [Pueribacillus theae]PWA13247.1 MerR family transcriptional regulator [Pueribacillus theae]
MLTEWGVCVGKFYRIGELADKANVSKRTIDYYTRIGLLKPIRSHSNYRFYEEDSIRILKLVEHYQKLNMPLDEIKNTIELLQSNGTLDCNEVTRHTEQIKEVMEFLEFEIKEIKPMLESLTRNQREKIMKSLSPQSTSLLHALLLLKG